MNLLYRLAQIRPRVQWTMIGVIAISVVLVIVAMTLISWFGPNHATLTVHNFTFNISVAQTPDQQHRGLGGVTHLASNQGMYFPVAGQPGISFWMKDMLIPIDIIWIKDGKVIGINQNVPPPAPDTPDTALPQYYPPSPNPDAVLEVAANRTQQLHIHPGDTIGVRK